MNNFVNFFLAIRNSKVFSGIVISVIVASAIFAGVSSYDISPQYNVYLDLFDYAITLFFVIEIVIRMISERSLIKFFKDGWNVFDFLIVTISLVPINNVESIFVARLLRIIRVLRIITVVPAFRHIIDSLVKSIPRVGFIALLMFQPQIEEPSENSEIDNESNTTNQKVEVLDDSFTYENTNIEVLVELHTWGDTTVQKYPHHVLSYLKGFGFMCYKTHAHYLFTKTSKNLEHINISSEIIRHYIKHILWKIPALRWIKYKIFG